MQDVVGQILDGDLLRARREDVGRAGIVDDEIGGDRKAPRPGKDARADVVEVVRDSRGPRSADRM